jgi:hypothetical protein
MQKRICRIAETLSLAAIALTSLSSSVWAGPPGPPVILAQLPRTPLGGMEVSIATAVGIAAYGVWKSRR